jgi:hypothetical protein
MDKKWSQELERMTQQMTRQIVNPYLTVETVIVYAREDHVTYESIKLRNLLLEKRKAFEGFYPLDYARFVRECSLDFEQGTFLERAYYRAHLLRIREEYESKIREEYESKIRK